MSDRSTTTADLANPLDPHPDRHAQAMPERIAAVLHIVHILATYGRHLADTIQRRSVRRGFATIAQFFPTAKVSVILAHIFRGIMRAVALERLLLQRAASGRDLLVFTPPDDTLDAANPAVPPWPDAAFGSNAPPTQPSAPQTPTRRPTREPFPQAPLTLDSLPSMRQVEAEVRRHPVGRTLLAICNDLGVAPILCSNAMWESLYRAFAQYRGSFDRWFKEMRRRQKRYVEQEVDANPNLGWPGETRDAVRKTLGFVVGEPPVDPFFASPEAELAVPATATGPP